MAKKAEADYPSMRNAEGDPDVDVVLTTREIARLIRADQIDVTSLPESDPDLPLGIGSGAGNIFGATGGVMEAALRTAYYMVNGKNPKPDAFKSVRGMKGWKEEEFELGGKTLKVAVVSGLGNANELLKQMKQNRVSYDFVEVMACPGGCVGGGGQPIREGFELAPLRAPILYMQDSGSNLRFSHENPAIKQVYQEFLGEPLSEKAEELLHTNHHKWHMPNER